MLPVVEPLPIDSLANLLRARRAHAAPGLVDEDALGLERQSAEIEHASHVALEVLDHVLVDYAQNAPGKHAIPMAHELEVRAGVARNLGDAVGEFLPVREELLEIAEAARHRLASRIDDL